MDALFNLLCPYFLPLDWHKLELGPALVALTSCYLASVDFTPIPQRPDRCSACGCPHTGPDVVAVCPGCGCRVPTEQPPMTGFELRSGWRVNLPLSIGLFWLDIVLIRVALLISYLRDHFSMSSAIVAMHRRELLDLSYHSAIPFYLLMLINPVCMVFAGASVARQLMIAKTLLVGVLALLAFGAPVGYH